MPSPDLRTVAVEVLTPREAKREHEALAREIAEHDRRYFQEDAPTVSDLALDAGDRGIPSRKVVSGRQQPPNPFGWRLDVDVDATHK